MSWCCLHCRASLAAHESGLRCPGCGRQYPVVAGMPILVREPAHYLRAELTALAQGIRDAAERQSWLDRPGAGADMTEVSRDRHRDIIGAEIARTEVLLDLLAPALRVLPEDAGEASGMRPAGWTVDALLPYLLRDWTESPELDAVAARIGGALQGAGADAPGTSIVFAACGAAGLLAALPPQFPSVLGFDLTLPILRAARHLLDGEQLPCALPYAIRPEGGITLRPSARQRDARHIELVAMDAFDTAFADASVDCVVTSFLLDLLPEPHRLATEIHRILRDGGIWINYGPPGTLKALWRFDQTEISAFLAAAGFTVLGSEGHRTTYLDLSRDCPTWSFQNHVCYLTTARKSAIAAPSRSSGLSTPNELSGIVPQHFPGAHLIRRQRLDAQEPPSMALRHDGRLGHSKTFDVTGDTARMLALVDGERTVPEIARLMQADAAGQANEDVVRAFARCFRRGLLAWRDE